VQNPPLAGCVDDFENTTRGKRNFAHAALELLRG
jgi:hypothetical protein